MDRFKAPTLAAMLALIGAFTAWWLLRPPAIPAELSSLAVVAPNPYSGPRAQVEDLRKGEFAPLADTARFAEAIQDNIEFVIIDSGLRETEGEQREASSAARIDHPAREQLGRKLLEYIEAFRSDAPDAYLSLARSESTEWLGKTSSAWKPIDFATDHWYGRHADRDDPQGALRDLLVKLRNNDEYSLIRGRIDPAGIDIMMAYGRVASDLERTLAWDNSPETYYFWMFGGGHSIRFREPAVSPEDIIRRDRGILFAHAFFVLSPSSDKPHVWRSVWYWDPQQEEWLNHVSESKSWFSMPMFY